MPDLTAARRLLRRLVATPEPPAPAAETLTASAGVRLVRLVESWTGAALATGGRGALAAALGRASAGERAAAFLTGAELAASLDLVATAAHRRLPLVLHVTADGGHEACHAAADAGAVLFFATGVEDAVDLTLLARRLAEDALAPVAVAMDGRETARAVHDARLPAAEAVARFLGRAGDVVHPPTPSQAMVFGDHRRRLPRWHDGARPLLHGAEPPALAGAARRAFFDVHLPELLAAAFGDFSRELGRRPEALATYHADDARFLLLAQGAAVETAAAAAAALRAAGVKAGAVGLRVLRPFPAAGLVELVRGRRGVVVLERLEAGAAAEPPLLAEMRALLERARESPHGAAGDLPALADREVPPLASAFYGPTLRAADLVALGRALAAGEAPSPVYLGIDTAAGDAAYPKRQALRDALRRDYPASVRLGLRSGDAADPAPPEGLAVAVHRIAADDGFFHDAAVLLHRLLGGRLRARPAVGEGWGVERVDLVTLAASPFPDPGDGVASGVAVWRAGKGSARPLLARIKDGGAVLLTDGARPSGLGPAVEERGLRVYVAREPSPPAPLREGEGSQERILGALASVLSLEGRSEVSLRKLLQVRRAMLEEDGGEDDVEARLDAVQAGFESVARIAAADLGEARPEANGGPPPAVRRLGRGTAPLADLPGFWDRVGVVDGRADALVPDPFLATAAVPPVTSALRDVSPARAVLPAFDPALCTGCGGCWSACPDAAVAPVAVDPAALLGYGMERAAARGRSVDKLRMATSKVASRVRREMAAPDWQGGAAGELFDAAFAATVDKMKLPDERKAELRDAYGAVREEIAALPVARTRPFFDDADDGEIFSLGLDPDACKGCGLCVAACEPGALTAAADDGERSAAARELWRLCGELPEAAAATRERARAHADVGPLAAALMSRAAREVMAGGHGAEPGSGPALALRQVLGVAADHVRPRRERQLAALRELEEKLAAAIHDTLAHALPDRDLDALARGLDALGQPAAELAELTARVETAFEDERVDVTRTRRLVEAARAVADLEWRWTTGESGLGQAPLGLVLSAPGLAWAAAFPHQPFRVPVTVDATGDAADLARGLAAGRLAETVEAARVLRRARLELDRPREAPQAAAELDRLAWEDLDDDERRLAAPLFVAICEDDLHGAAAGSLAALLASDLPVKALVLQAWAAEDDPSSSSLNGLHEATKKTAFFAPSSVAHFDQLAAAVAGALDHDGPALLRVLAPSPAHGGFAADATLARARQRVEAGAFALAGEPSPREPSPPAPLPEGEGSETSEGEGARIAELEARHAAEIAALRRDYEGRLAAAQAGLKTEMARRLRARLMQIALRPPGSGGAAPEARE